MVDCYYETDTSSCRAKLKEAAPELLQAFIDFDRKVFAEGKLGLKTKELIALACAHITQCPYCIDGHTKRARRAGATDTEIAEAVFVAVAIRAGGGIAHSCFAMRSSPG